MALMMTMMQLCQKLQSPVTMKEVKLTVRSHNHLFLQNQERFITYSSWQMIIVIQLTSLAWAKPSSGEIRNITNTRERWVKAKKVIIRCALMVQHSTKSCLWGNKVIDLDKVNSWSCPRVGLVKIMHFPSVEPLKMLSWSAPMSLNHHKMFIFNLL